MVGEPLWPARRMMSLPSLESCALNPTHQPTPPPTTTTTPNRAATNFDFPWDSALLSRWASGAFPKGTVTEAYREKFFRTAVLE